MKMNLPVDEAQKMVEEVEKSGMGYLFENFEKCDIQEERRKTKEAQAKLKEAREDAKETQAKLKEARADAEEARADAKEARADAKEARADAEKTKADAQKKIAFMEEKLVLGLCEEGYTKEEALKKLQERFGFEESEAKRLLATYWK